MTSPVQQIVTTQQLTAVAAALYTSPTAEWTQIVALGVLNTDTLSHQVTIYIVPSGGMVATATLTTSGYNIVAKGNYNGQNEFGMVLNPGDTLWAFADTGSVLNIFAAGLISS